MADAQPTRWSVLRTRLADVVRVVLVVAILVVGWSVARSFARLFADWRGPAQLTAKQAVAENVAAMPGLLPLAGQWSFAELDWTVRSQAVKGSEVDSRLASLRESGNAMADDALPNADEDLLELVEKLHITPTREGGNRVYRFERDGLRAQLILRAVAGQEKTVLFVAAVAGNGDEWQLLEITPRESAGAASEEQPHLLPLPATANRTGGRYADDGKLLLELVTVGTNANELVAAWEAAGWTVRPSGRGGAADFSCLCAKGEKVVYAWSADPRDSLQNLMLVHTPTSADTGR